MSKQLPATWGQVNEAVECEGKAIEAIRYFGQPNRDCEKKLKTLLKVCDVVIENIRGVKRMSFAHDLLSAAVKACKEPTQ